jgi:hypothetical protein
VTEELRRVELRDIDVQQLWLLEQHHEAMLRELTLIAIGEESGEAHATPKKVLHLVGRARERFIDQREGVLRQLREATEQGRDTVTIELRMPPSAAEAIHEAAEAYDLADDYCRAGDLLTLACPPEVASLRRELCTRITAQLQTSGS